MGVLQHSIFEVGEIRLQGHDIEFCYALRGGPDADLTFCETLSLPYQLPAPNGDDDNVKILLSGIQLALGVSYYKTCVPENIVLPSPLPREEAHFWNTLYGEGMGEFWYSNSLDPRGRINFPESDAQSLPLAQTHKHSEKALVLVGGGKDSAVAAEIVKAAGVSAAAFSVGTSNWQQRSADAMGLKYLIAKRRIDPKLFELNAKGAYNGHVPISACIAFIAELVAYLGGYSDIVVANEGSANEGNTQWCGIDINHQWSKSLKFERAFQHWIAFKADGLPNYFSLLRTMGELEIAALFAKKPQHFSEFASCNANFKVQGRTTSRWCGVCPKCVFVQLAMKPFLGAAAMQDIFSGENFLENQNNRTILRDLLGAGEHKPFECVGSQAECQAAMAVLHSRGDLSDELSAWFKQYFPEQVNQAALLWQQALAPSVEHAMPAQWLERVDAYRRSA